MPARLQFFDMSVTTTPPAGHLEPLPVTLGPNWRPNDLRLIFVSGSGNAGSTTLMMSMHPDPPPGFSAAYSLNPGAETHGVYWRRLRSGDTDTAVSWGKPQGWRHFMLAVATVRGVSPTATPTAGSVNIAYTVGDSTGTTATAPSITVPGAGAVALMAGNVPAPMKTQWPSWAVALGVPAGWTHLVATEKSGLDFASYDTSPSVVVVGKAFTGPGSTGPVVFPTAHGTPAFAALWVHLPAAQDVSATIGPA